MLNESEARAIDEIEQRLRATDPAFAQRMATGPAPRPFPAVPVLCVTVFLSLPFIALLCGPRAALATADVAAVTVVIILARRHHRTTRRPNLPSDA
ncbi:DUF3040 domain-containing protein [Actinoplanes sp. NBC_00393]|uniref:DUF3040 domain-containing protein n=1 Tax=Actinoplanes sp. NBC_00393 TaxID=2975953 RepID=UPI002E1D3208